jgi:vacuolar-type H+-ATPase subunit I/STV1
VPHQNYLRVLLAVLLSLTVAGLYSSAAEEKNQLGPQAASAKARLAAAKTVYEGSWKHHIEEPESGPSAVEYYHDWSVRWLQAERDLSQTKAEQITALEGHLKRMQLWKEMLEKNAQDGNIPTYAAQKGQFYRLEAEDWLTAAKAESK